jgi:hypothetical protein
MMATDHGPATPASRIAHSCPAHARAPTSSTTPTIRAAIASAAIASAAAGPASMRSEVRIDAAARSQQEWRSISGRTWERRSRKSIRSRTGRRLWFKRLRTSSETSKAANCVKKSTSKNDDTEKIEVEHDQTCSCMKIPADAFKHLILTQSDLLGTIQC